MDSISTKKIIAIVVIFASLCAYTWSLRLRAVPLPDDPDLEAIPRSIGRTAAKDEHISPQSLRVLGADLTLARSYTSGYGDRIDLFIGYFSDQQERSQIHSPKHCYPGAGWDIISEGSITVDLDGSASSVRRLLISDGRSRQLVVYWFNMRGRTITNEFELKWHQMTSALLSRPQSASFIRFSIPLAPGAKGSEENDLVEFIEDISPYILDALAPGPREDGS
jgi:EpsI family protein